MVTSVQTVETRTEAMRRLLDVARESGVKLGMDSSGDIWATSVSEPGWLYPVTPESCGCWGFATHRRCRHVAALWSHLGYFDPEPEPTVTNVTVDPEPGVNVFTPDEPASCPVCNGSGVECGTVSSGRTWRYENVVCANCHGTGRRIAAAA